MVYIKETLGFLYAVMQGGIRERIDGGVRGADAEGFMLLSRAEFSFTTLGGKIFSTTRAIMAHDGYLS